jgi:hypothetical protein
MDPAALQGLAILQQLLAHIQAQPPAPAQAPQQEAQVQVPVIVPPAQTVPASQYVAPLTGNPAAGASISLLSSFPEVEAATITAVIQHELRGTDIYKLDSRYRDKTERQTLAFNGTSLEIASNDSAAKDYKTLNSIIIPLNTYFSILLMHSQPTGRSHLLLLWFFRYNTHIVKLASEYKWSAVLAYHMAFFARRRREMSEDGNYREWGKMDFELHGEHLMDRCKPATAARPANPSMSGKHVTQTCTNKSCRNFNLGKCATTPCA